MVEVGHVHGRLPRYRRGRPRPDDVAGYCHDRRPDGGLHAAVVRRRASPTCTTTGTPASPTPSHGRRRRRPGRASPATGGRRVLELGVGTGRLAVPLATPARRASTSPASTRARRCSARLAAQRPRRAVTAVSATWSTTSRPARSTSSSSPTTRCSTSTGRRASRRASPPSPRGWRRAEGSSSRRSCPRTRRAPARSWRCGRCRPARSCCRSRRTTPPPSARRALRRVRRRRAGAPAAVVDPLRDARPSSTRWRTPPGSRSADRWEDFDRHPFGDDSARHVSVYRRDARSTGVTASARSIAWSTPGMDPILGTHCESDASQPSHRAVGHDRGRAGRTPSDFAPARREFDDDAERPCPFCPGNEDATLPRSTPSTRAALADAGHPQPVPGVRRQRRLRRPPPRPGPRHRRGQRHPRGVRLHARPRRRPGPARRRAAPPS